MSLTVARVRDVFRYNGVELKAPPGSTWEDVRSLHSAFYPELITAVPEFGEVQNGIREVTFAKSVGTKGADGRSLRDFVASMQALTVPCAHIVTPLMDGLLSEEGRTCGHAWGGFATAAKDAPPHERRAVPSSSLAPLP